MAGFGLRNFFTSTHDKGIDFSCRTCGIEMTKPRAVNGVCESGRFAPTFTHPQIHQSHVTSSQKTK